MQHALLKIRRLSAMYEVDLGFTIENKAGEEIAAFIVKRTAEKEVADFDWCWCPNVFTGAQIERVLKPLALAIIETGAICASLRME